LFAELQKHVPTATVSEVHRARNEWERDAWQRVRDGEAQRALVSYDANDRLHIADTREQAAERMLETWEAARRERPEQRTVMLTDSSNVELERINARAQERRAHAGELGAREAELPSRPYGLRAGDEVIFTAALYRPGTERVENGTLGTVLDIAGDRTVTVQTQGDDGREVNLDTREFSDVRLSYAQHVYKAQGRTVEQALVLMGGWQTDRERAYVALTRARDRTDIYVAREDLGEQGMDAGAIERLADSIAKSNAQQPSIAAAERPRADLQASRYQDARGTHEEHEPGELGFGLGASRGPETEPPRDSQAARTMRETEPHRPDHDRDLGPGFALD
jgi:ATP-dependent exoDNAse (exonuclease V) alpha subunit